MPFTSTRRSANIGLKPTEPLAEATPFPSTPNRTASVPFEPRAVARFSRRRSVFVRAYWAGRLRPRSSIFTVQPRRSIFRSVTSQGADGGGGGASGFAFGASSMRSALPSFSRTMARTPFVPTRLPRVNACFATSSEDPAISSDAAVKNGSFSLFFLRRGPATVIARSSSVVFASFPVENVYRVLRPRTPASIATGKNSSTKVV